MNTGKEIVLTGDHRDIAMSLGLIVMVWNRCEGNIRLMLRSLSAAGEFNATPLTEILIVELGSIGLTDALPCYSDEFPEAARELAEEIKFTANYFERARAYRNYYVHGINGITEYGLNITDKMIELDTPVHEAMTIGPYAQAYVKSAKGKQRFTLEFIDKNTLVSFNNRLSAFDDYLSGLLTCVNEYFRLSEEIIFDRASLPKRPTLPTQLRKPVLDHPRLRHNPALARKRLDNGEEG